MLRSRVMQAIMMKLGYCSDLRGLRVLGERGITTDKKQWAKVSNPRRFLIKCVLINNNNIVNLRLGT